jgi:predicted O-methyltransferase YrrM
VHLATTYEQIVELLIDELYELRCVPARFEGHLWSVFLRLSDLIHDHFTVPSTTVTPIMRRLLFALGVVRAPSTLVGIGTFVGYPFAWLLRNRADLGTSHFQQALGVDLDTDANALARHNCDSLAHGRLLDFVDGDGCEVLRRCHILPIDLLYIDLDDPLNGKYAYKEVLSCAAPLLAPRALVVAHDPCVQRFSADFRRFHEYIAASPLFEGPWVLPVDACGLTVAVGTPQ